MLAFAERAAAPMYYVSTAFVANPPSAERRSVRRRRAYIDSKVEAEQLTRDSDVATVIVRPVGRHRRLRATAGWPPSRGCTGSPGSSPRGWCR